MAQQQLIWTALPHGAGTGANAGKQYLSVIVSPRLGGATTLTAFPDWLNWPETSKSIKFKVHVGGTEIPAEQVRRLPPTGFTAGALTPQDVWTKALFPPDTPVEPYVFESPAENPVLSYRMRSIQALVRSSYVAAGLDSPSGTPVSRLIGPAGILNPLVRPEAMSSLRTMTGPVAMPNLGQLGLSSGVVLRSLTLNTSGAPRAQAPDVATNFAMLRAFHGEATAPVAATVPQPGPSSGGPISVPGVRPRLTVPGVNPANRIVPELRIQRQIVPRSGAMILRPEDTVRGRIPDIRVRPGIGPGIVIGPGTPINPTPTRAGQPTSVASGLKPGFAQSSTDSLDFHRQITALLDHPSLMEWLGIVIELEIPAAAMAAGAAVWVEAIWTPKLAATTNQYPHTLLAPNVFRPLPRTFRSPTGANGAAPEVTPEGLVRLKDGNYDVLNFDIDGAAIKLGNAAENITRQISDATPQTQQQVILPALRSAGLTLARTGRDAKFTAGLQTATANNTALATISMLQADDVARGLRVDVREVLNEAANRFGPWRSLCRRAMNYTFQGVGNASAREEGVVTLSVANKQVDGQQVFKVHEAVFRWVGWSLCVPAPLPPDAPAGGPAVAPPKPWGLKSQITLDGTLPLLRFGRTYQFRLRAADISGYSLSPAEPDDSQTSDADEGFYARAEPVKSPVIIPRVPVKDSPGESPERLVVRSNFNTTQFNMTSDRHIAPPKADFDMVTAHGELDNAAGDALDPSKSALLPRLTQDFNPIEPDAIISTPYLPDPMAYSATIVGLGPAKPLLSVPFLQAGLVWHRAAPFRLSLQAAKDGPVPVPAPVGHVLPVVIPQGQIVRINLSCAPENKAALELFSVFRWFRDGIGSGPNAAAKLVDLENLAAAGLHAMITPPRPIVLVHAVQQPLILPEFSSLVPVRAPGQTWSRFTGALACDAKTTGKVDVFAAWEEPVDDFSSDRPDTTRRKGEARAWEVPMYFAPEDDPTSPFNDPATAQVAPDKRVSVYDTDAPAMSASIGPSGQRTVATYAPTQRQLLFVPPPFMPSVAVAPSNLPRHEFGDTKHRRVRYHAVATSRFREYFLKPDGTTPDLTRGDGAEIKEIIVEVPSSARPDAPKVRYIMPTFRWDKSTGQSERRCGLRVYLDRPWWSTGDDEMLAVVLWQGPPNVRRFGDAGLSGANGDSTRLAEAETAASEKVSRPASLLARFGGLRSGFIRVADTPLMRPRPRITIPDASNAPGNIMVAPGAAVDNNQVLRPGGGAVLTVPNGHLTDRFQLRPAEQELPPELRPYATQWGRDPMWNSAHVPGLLIPGDFSAAATLPQGAKTTDLPLEEVSSQTVTAVPHKVAFDPDRNLWYCDIEVDSGKAYSPFIRLALARYQPYSVNGMHLSRVTMPDFIQLLPPRTFKVEMTSLRMGVMVSGPAPIAGPAGVVFSAPSPITTEMEAVLEHKVGSDPDLGWVAVPDAKITLNASDNSDGIQTWRASFPAADHGAGPFRVVVREYERIATDLAGSQKDRRLVYADTIEL